MTQPQIQILAILLATVALFIWGRWRHDLVALASLLACSLAGLVSVEQAFVGFGHPAVITVACVLILSRGLQDTGAVDRITQKFLPENVGTVAGIIGLAGLGALLSAFMNNVGAMALLLPVGLQLSKRLNLPPSRVLMPLAFGTILGGMTTLIGTPPNLIVAGFRAQTGDGGFGMFDYSPVGVSVALAGLLFLGLIGWRFVPARRPHGAEDFDTGTYLVEALVAEGSKSIGVTVGEAGAQLDQEGAQIVGVIRQDTRLFAPNPRRRIKMGDILVIETEPADLADVLTDLDVTLEEPRTTVIPEAAEDDPAGPVILQEMVVMPPSSLVGRSSIGAQIRSRHGLSLLAVSRQGQRKIRRVRTMRFKPGDLLLLQGNPAALGKFASHNSLVPLANRDIRLPSSGRAKAAAGIMVVAIGLAAAGILSAPISFALGALVMGASGVIPARDIYKAVDWPVIILLAALIPVAGAMATTGTADLIADTLLNKIAGGAPVIALGLLLVVTMTLSDFMNNAATAAVMCPISLSIAQQLGVNSDPFLMAVAIGASCAFLTPIGHQNNTLILGPGGLRFGDYWKLGLPMEILVVAVSIPALLVFWPM
jgi:di/tricarboxylate transporter